MCVLRELYVLCVRAWRERGHRAHTLWPALGRAFLVHPLALGEIQHRRALLALGLRHQPSGKR